MTSVRDMEIMEWLLEINKLLTEDVWLIQFESRDEMSCISNVLTSIKSTVDDLGDHSDIKQHIVCKANWPSVI